MTSASLESHTVFNSEQPYNNQLFNMNRI